MPKDIIKVSASKKLSWQKSCVLCLKDSTKEDRMVIGSGNISNIPYCDNCFYKVQRLSKWKDNLFMISLIIGALGAVVYIIFTIVEKSWLELLRVQSWFIIGAGGLLFMGIAYLIMWLMLLPFRLIFHTKLANPGVKILKSKKPGETILKFSNQEYANIFRKGNELIIHLGTSNMH